MLRILPDHLINQIAAGEVIERPAAAVKELVENALDAGATQIRITLRQGGTSYLAVQDNGRGMIREELPLAVARHATSKLPQDDLNQINYLGFRGEALASLGAVARLSITTLPKTQEHGWKIYVAGGKQEEVVPTSCAPGTLVEISDLFFATPARLKFLKSPRSEAQAVHDMVRRLSMTRPDVGFSLSNDNKQMLQLAPAASMAARAQGEYPTPHQGEMMPNPHLLRPRLERLFTSDFIAHAYDMQAQKDNWLLGGILGAPTDHKPNQNGQYFFVNGRVVRDKALHGIIRAAYGDTVPHGRYPALVLFMALPGPDVDVNVHPAKAEIRFRDAQAMRGFIIGSIRQVLAQMGHQPNPITRNFRPGSSSFFPGATRAIHSGTAAPLTNQNPINTPFSLARTPDLLSQAPPMPPHHPLLQENDAPGHGQGYGAPNKNETPDGGGCTQEKPEFYENWQDYPLGRACAQLHKTYIISQSAQGLVVVDQHAAHERLVYEKMKQELAQGQVAQQNLLIPEVVELDTDLCHNIISYREAFAQMGLVIEEFGADAILVRATPCLFGQGDIQSLMRDLASLVSEQQDAQPLKDMLERVCATLSCHGSVRAGRTLSLAEMDALLRQIETTDFSGQCNHGRPTYVTFDQKNLEKLFRR